MYFPNSDNINRRIKLNIFNSAEMVWILLWLILEFQFDASLEFF